MAQPYAKRMLIRLTENDKSLYLLSTHSGLDIATGYQRVVIGKRGPYIEFTDTNLIKTSIFIPENEKWRLNSKLAYYHEYRTIDKSYVKFYYQRKTVAYADYLVGMWYVSPFDLLLDGKETITPINKKSREQADLSRNPSKRKDIFKNKHS